MNDIQSSAPMIQSYRPPQGSDTPGETEIENTIPNSNDENNIFDSVKGEDDKSTFSKAFNHLSSTGAGEVSDLLDELHSLLD